MCDQLLAATYDPRMVLDFRRENFQNLKEVAGTLLRAIESAANDTPYHRPPPMPQYHPSYSRAPNPPINPEVSHATTENRPPPLPVPSSPSVQPLTEYPVVQHPSNSSERLTMPMGGPNPAPHSFHTNLSHMAPVASSEYPSIKGMGKLTNRTLKIRPPTTGPPVPRSSLPQVDPPKPAASLMSSFTSNKAFEVIWDERASKEKKARRPRVGQPPFSLPPSLTRPCRNQSSQ